MSYYYNKQSKYIIHSCIYIRWIQSNVMRVFGDESVRKEELETFGG